MTNDQQASIEQELTRLGTLSPAALRDRYRELFGESSRSGNRAFLAKRIAWRAQAAVEGTLSDRARRRAMEIAGLADLRTTIPRVRVAPPGTGGPTTGPLPMQLPLTRRLPMPGTVLTRVYQGRTLAVTVLPKGFEHEGTVYRSLSGVARAITGAHWNGYLFFGLTGKGRP